MPLVAKDGATGERITSLDLGTASWDALVADLRAKRRKLTTPCCGTDAAARVSPLGLRHFYHRNAREIVCEHTSESPDHLALKLLVIAALREAGWEARPTTA